MIPKTPQKIFCHFIVRMSHAKSLNISRSPNARALVLVPKHFYGALMLLKLFQNWSGGFGVIPIFHFFEILKNFSFLGLSREPFDSKALRYVCCTRGQNVKMLIVSPFLVTFDLVVQTFKKFAFSCFLKSFVFLLKPVKKIIPLGQPWSEIYPF